MLSTIGNIADFPSEGKLAAYFGIVPRVQNSNAVERRRAYHQAGLHARAHGSDKAIIALARKFLGMIYTTLTHNWIFEDFPWFVLADG